MNLTEVQQKETFKGCWNILAEAHFYYSLFQPIVLQEEKLSMVRSKVLHSSHDWLELPFQLAICFLSEQLKILPLNWWQVWCLGLQVRHPAVFPGLQTANLPGVVICLFRDPKLQARKQPQMGFIFPQDCFQFFIFMNIHADWVEGRLHRDLYHIKLLDNKQAWWPTLFKQSYFPVRSCFPYQKRSTDHHLWQQIGVNTCINLLIL